ncbi:MAG: phage tail sheath subtilisin-like domain-containing protein [Chitinophagales bacterium]|nr:phage tail sheath subtilisin-like domain-containing protein [Chitinophagales bacterium]
MLNLSTLKTPGVYIDEVSVLAPAVAGVATSIPAFIGYTEKSTATDDTAQEPVRITNLREYEETFGKPQAEDDGLSLNIIDHTDSGGNILRTEFPIPKMDEVKRSKHILYYALQLYFSNGGGPCYIISIGAYSVDGQSLNKKHFKNGLDALAMEDEPTLIVMPEAVGLSNGDYAEMCQAALDQSDKLQDRFAIIDVKNNSDNALTDATAFRNLNIANNLRYGAAYYPYLKTTIDYRFVTPETGIKVTRTEIDPAGTETEVYKDKPLSDLSSSDNLLYKQLQNLLTQVEMLLPPSGAIAGIYVQTDASRGVWKAPANVGVTAINGVNVKIDEDTHGELNVDVNAGKSINAIRSFVGRGTLVWGARTLDGNDNEWRYVNVRRFFNFVEESVKKATFRFVFEPNDANTWVSVRAMVENFLILQWRAGALQGAKPEQAFFVRVGLGQTMTQDDILNGRLIIEVGMAVVRPAEFIVIRFMHKLPEA